MMDLMLILPIFYLRDWIVLLSWVVLQNFLDIDYYDVKYFLGLGPRDFNITFRNPNGSIVESNGKKLTHGISLPIEEENIYVVKRGATLNDNRITMELIVWD